MENNQQEMIELEHSIGFTGRHQDTLMFHPKDSNTLIYNNGGLVVIEDLHDKHKQEFLRGHDMEISTMTASNNGQLLATGQIGTVFQKNPEAPVILWDLPNKQPLAVLKGLSIAAKTLRFSPDDRFLAAVGQSNTIIIWDTQDGSAIYTRVFE